MAVDFFFWYSWMLLSLRLYILDENKFWKSKFSYWNWTLTHPQNMSQRISLKRPYNPRKLVPQIQMIPQNIAISIFRRFSPHLLSPQHIRVFNKNLKDHKQRNQKRTLYDIKLSKSTLNWKRLLNITFCNTFCNTNCTL